MFEADHAIIAVRHRFADGWHEFTSDVVPGLYVVAEEADLAEAYNEIPLVIQALIAADFGKQSQVRQAKSFESYEASLPAPFRTSSRFYQVEMSAAA